MNRIFFAFTFMLSFLSCQSQDKIDLEKVDFQEGYKSILNNTQYITEAQELVTTLPFATTKDVGGFKFGDVELVKSPKESPKSSLVGVLINNINEKMTKGILIEIEETSKSEAMFKYLSQKYEKVKVLSPIPSKNSAGRVLGNSAFLWNTSFYSVVLVQYYEYTDGKPNVSSILYLVDNKVLTSDSSEKVISRIERTFKK